MPRHTRTFLLLTLVLAVLEGLLIFQEASGAGASRVLPAAFFATGIGVLVYGGRQEEEKDRAIVRGASIVPFGCFLVSVAVAGWVAILDTAAATVTA